MFCPGCGSPTTAETKFCKQCGTNLRGVRELQAGRSEPFDWAQTWLADMFLTTEELDRRRGVTPEMKRNREIRTGVITSFAGIGVMLFLYFFLDTVAAQRGPEGAEILRRVWLAGLVPFFVGLGIILNGLIIGGREVRKHRELAQALPFSPPLPSSSQGKTTDQLAAPPAATALPEFGVTEHTTAHLPAKYGAPEPASVRREMEQEHH